MKESLVQGDPVFGVTKKVFPAEGFHIRANL